MRFIPFEPQHLSQIEPQAAQAPFVDWMTPDIAEIAAEHFAFTGVDDKGLVGAAGFVSADDGSLIAWALFSERIARHAKALLRAVKNGIAMHEGRRIVAFVAADHGKAARFAEALDFQCAGRVTHPNGRDVLLYALER